MSTTLDTVAPTVRDTGPERRLSEKFVGLAGRRGGESSPNGRGRDKRRGVRLVYGTEKFEDFTAPSLQRGAAQPRKAADYLTFDGTLGRAVLGSAP